MIPYAEFRLTKQQIHFVKLNNQQKSIRNYIKQHGVEPDPSTVESFYTATRDDLEHYRRVYYSLLYDKSYIPSDEPTGPEIDPPTGSTIDSGETIDSGTTIDSGETIDSGTTVDSGSTEESGSTIDSGSTEDSGSTIDSGDTVDSGSTEESGTTEEEITSPSSQFVLSLNPIPCAVGDGEWSNYAISVVRGGILNGDLLDYKSASVRLSGNNGTVLTVTDLTKSYFIPEGEYVAEGWIGRNGSRGFHDWNWPQYDKGWVSVYGQFIIDSSNKSIPLTMEINDAVAVSDKEFRGKTGGSPRASYEYSNMYYFFVRNDYHTNGLSTPYIAGAVPMTFLFDGVEYTVDSFDMGSAYCYGWNGIIPQDYSGNTGQMDYDEFVRLTYNVTGIYNPTRLFYSSASTEGIGYMEIDGQSVVPTDEYLFTTLGTHKVDVLLKDSSTMLPLKFTNVPSLREIVIPSTVDDLGSKGLFNNCQGIEKITCMSIVAPSCQTYLKTGNGTAAGDFFNINGNGTLYVPYGSVSSYRSSNYSWIGSIGSSNNDSFKNLSSYGWTIEELLQSND